MIISKTKIKDLYIIQLEKYIDNRGWFVETYSKSIFSANEIKNDFIQDNHSYSRFKGTLRGLHFQKKPYEQAKLVRCIKGSVFDVAVDLRKNSETYLEWFSIELSETNNKMLLIPKGFAHGFLTLEDNTEVQYKVDEIYSPINEYTLRFDDSKIKVNWPKLDYVLSDKDRKGKEFFQVEDII